MGFADFSSPATTPVSLLSNHSNLPRSSNSSNTACLLSSGLRQTWPCRRRAVQFPRSSLLVLTPPDCPTAPPPAPSWLLKCAHQLFPPTTVPPPHLALCNPELPSLPALRPSPPGPTHSPCLAVPALLPLVSPRRSRLLVPTERRSTSNPLLSNLPFRRQRRQLPWLLQLRQAPRPRSHTLSRWWCGSSLRSKRLSA